MNNIAKVLIIDGEQKICSFDEVVKMYSPLLFSLPDKFHYNLSKYSNLFDKDDIIQEGSIGLYKAFNKYDYLSSVAFGYYCKICVFNQVQSFMKKSIKYNSREKKKFSFFSFDSPIASSSQEDSDIYYKDTIHDISQSQFDNNLMVKFTISDNLSISEKEVLEMNAAGFNQSEIAKKLHLSQPQISRIKRKAISKLNNVLYC